MRCIDCVTRAKRCAPCKVATEASELHERLTMNGQTVLAIKCPVPTCRNVTSGAPCRSCRTTFGPYLVRRAA